MRSVHLIRATVIAFTAIATSACGRDDPVSPYIPPEEEEPPIATDMVSTESVAPRGGLDRVSAYGPSLPEGLTARPILTFVDAEPTLADRYPDELARFGQRRSVGLALLVDEFGEVREAEIVSSSGALAVDLAASEIARARRYSPARRGDEPVAVWLEDVTIGWPLVVLDGVPRPDMPLVSVGVLTHEIDHVEIIKGKASASVFGEWADGGSISITTKRRSASGAARRR
ncbi:MAG: TonB family protein [Gemmatimonadota bacterium]|nr:TonB family protein [Gemmatimonadota bacterium]